MRKPVENPVPEPTEPSTAVVLVGAYELFAQSIGPFTLFKASLPARYQVVEATHFKTAFPPPRTISKLIIRVRQLGEGAVGARFLVVWSNDGQTQLPWIKPSPHDPPDSAMLQWSFWQGCRVGGGLYHDVFDVTHFAELQLPER